MAEAKKEKPEDKVQTKMSGAKKEKPEDKAQTKMSQAKKENPEDNVQIEMSEEKKDNPEDKVLSKIEELSQMVELSKVIKAQKEKEDKVLSKMAEEKKEKPEDEVPSTAAEAKKEKPEDELLYPTIPLKIKMKEQSIIPDVLNEFPPALIDLQVIYDEKEDIKVDVGNVLTPTKVQNAPIVKWTPEPDTFYLLCMTDPDAPSRETPIMREWHHWLVGNIPGDEIDKGETLSEYIGSGPPKGTGKHRYVFLLYQQKKKLNFTEHRLTNKSTKGRAQFSIKKFAEKYKLGDPIAGNFFLAEFDDYVPKLYEQLHCC